MEQLNQNKRSGSPQLKKALAVLGRFSPPLLFCVSLLLLRMQVAGDLGIGLNDAFAAGLDLGILYDIVLVLISVGVAFLTTWRRAWIPIAFVFWFACFSNVIYFRFFGTRLEWWIVQLHWRDIWVLDSTVGQLGATLPLVSSVFVFLLSIAAAWFFYTAAQPKLKSVALGLVFIVGALLLRQSPVWFHRVAFQGAYSTGEATVLGEQIWTVWFNEWTGLGRSMKKELAQELEGSADRRPAQILEQFRTLKVDRGIPSVTHLDAFEWPLYRDFRINSSDTHRLREELGLPTEGKINVFVLFMESTRSFEFFHPKIGPVLFSNTWEVLNKHGIVFKQGYSSSGEAGQTVRGQFSALCSMLPNFRGPATYIAYNTLRVSCIQDLLSQNGYDAVWINSLKKSFHSSNIFETLHGTEHFYDESYFLEKGITQKTGEWGLADGPVLEEAVRIFENHARLGKSVFANFLTISTHFPHEPVQGIELPKELRDGAKRSPEYAGYLSQLKYLDQSLGHFFRKMFESSVADRTAVILLGDHSVPVQPVVELTEVQKTEMGFRVPIALVSKNLKEPRIEETPVHQIDVAPTIARLTGVKGRVSWLGRGLLSGEGSPWVYQSGERLQYRTGDFGCYQEKGKVSCFDLTQADPLFSTRLARAPRNKEMDQFFRDVVRSARQAIVFNLLTPAAGGTQ